MQRKKRILYVHHQGKLAGAERSLLHLFQCLDRDSYEVFVACPDTGRFVEQVEKLGIQVSPFFFSSIRHIFPLLKNIIRLVRLLKHEKVDIIHSNSPKTNIPCGIAGKLAGIPVVWHARTMLEPGMTDLDRLFSRFATHIICNSQAIRNRFVKIKGYENRTSVIINAVDLDRFSPYRRSKEEVRKELNVPPEAFVMGTFDRLDPIKDHETMIKGFAKVVEEYENSILLIIGEAFLNSKNRKGDLESLTESLGIQSSVRFLGFQDDISKYMTACDCIIQASRLEGCSRVLCEAQAIGRPVIASSAGGNPELIEQGKTGLLFQVEDYNSLAKHILFLLTHREEAKRMGVDARKKAEKDFSLSRYCEQTTSVYETVM